LFIFFPGSRIAAAGSSVLIVPSGSRAERFISEVLLSEARPRLHQLRDDPGVDSSEHRHLIRLLA
jgi:hypothetical protein